MANEQKVFRDHQPYPIIRRPTNEQLINAAIKRRRNAGIVVHHDAGTTQENHGVEPWKNNDFDTEK